MKTPFFKRFKEDHAFSDYLLKLTKPKSLIILWNTYIHSLNFASIRLINETYENEVTMTGKNLPLKSCQYLEISFTLRKSLDLTLLKILDL